MKHHLYKNRLVRCYLGARRSDDRNPQPFTGFDPDDDMTLASFCGIEILRSLPPHQRRSEHYGWRGTGVAATPRDFFHIYAVRLWLRRGARDRASPGESARTQRFPRSPIAAPKGMPTRTGEVFPWGQQSRSPGRRLAQIWGTTLLLRWRFYSDGVKRTARLVVGQPASVEEVSPELRPTDIGLMYLLNELFGKASARSAYVNITDGGHFENLGVYELIRRRCRFIIASDAEQDQLVRLLGGWPTLCGAAATILALRSILDTGPFETRGVEPQALRDWENQVPRTEGAGATRKRGKCSGYKGIDRIWTRRRAFCCF